MVSSIGSTSPAQYQSGVGTDNKMTDDQKEELNDLLGKFDPDKMDETQTKTMMNDIKSLGIKPGEDLKNALQAKGFKTHHKGGRHHGAGSASAAAGAQATAPQFVQDFAKQLQAGNVSQDTIDAFIQNVQSSGSQDQGLLVDQKV